MGKYKTLDYIAEHVATSFDKELRESVENMLYEEDMIEESNEEALLLIDEVMLQIGDKIFDIYHPIVHHAEKSSNETEDFQGERLREAGISQDEYENGDPYDEGDSSRDEHYS